MFKLTARQERALSKMAPEAAARRRATMMQERDIILSSRMVSDLRCTDPDLANDLYGPSLGELARRK